MSFDRAIWRAQHDSAALELDNQRLKTASSLTREILVPGMARDEVLAILGPPEFSEGETDHYELGRSAMGVDFEQLLIEYGGGKLVGVAARRS